MLDRKMNEPLFEEGYKKYKWHVIHYDALKKFFQFYQNNKKIEDRDLQDLK